MKSCSLGRSQKWDQHIWKYFFHFELQLLIFEWNKLNSFCYQNWDLKNFNNDKKPIPEIYCLLRTIYDEFLISTKRFQLVKKIRLSNHNDIFEEKIYFWAINWKFDSWHLFCRKYLIWDVFANFRKMSRFGDPNYL